jgi:hypothetical protein
MTANLNINNNGLLINSCANFGETNSNHEVARTANRRLAKKRVQWLVEHSSSYQLLCWVESLVLRKPLLRQAPNRCTQAEKIYVPEID